MSGRSGRRHGKILVSDPRPLVFDGDVASPYANTHGPAFWAPLHCIFEQVADRPAKRVVAIAEDGCRLGLKLEIDLWPERTGMIDDAGDELVEADRVGRRDPPLAASELDAVAQSRVDLGPKLGAGREVKRGPRRRP